MIAIANEAMHAADDEKVDQAPRVEGLQGPG